MIKFQESIARRTVWPALVLVVGVSAQTPPKAAVAPPLPAATGRIHYKLSGAMVNGEMSLSWLDHGKKFREEMNMVGGPNGMKMQTWNFSDGESVYTKLPTGQNQVIRMKIPKDPASQKRMQSQIMAQMGMQPNGKAIGKSAGKGTVLGKPCEIRVAGNQKVWIWNGFPLRMEVSSPQGRNMSFVATQVETSPHLSPALFTVPPGYVVRDMPFPSGARAPGAPRTHP